MLDALAAAHWIAPEAAHELKEAYGFLRMVENRIQMTADQQTHELPGDEEAFAVLAHFCGFQSADDFDRRLGRRSRPFRAITSLCSRIHRNWQPIAATWCLPAARMTPRP